MNDLKVGQIVRSTAGRDKDSWMVVIDIIDDNYVGICNGGNRKVSNPKKKKIKHLAKTNTIEPCIQEMLNKGIKVSNSEIRRILKPFEDKLTENENLNQ